MTMLTMEQEERIAQATNELNLVMPYAELKYRNMVVAHAIAIGKGITEDWLRNGLLSDVEDGFIQYSQAIAIKDKYFNAVKTVASHF